MPALLLLVLFLLILTTVFGSLVYYFESGTFRVTTQVSQHKHKHKHSTSPGLTQSR